MRLTRPQLIAFWSIGTQMPINAEFELETLTQNNYDDIFLVITTDFGSARYKLPARGGYESVGEDRAKPPKQAAPTPE